MATLITVDAEQAIAMLGGIASSITPDRFMRNVGMRLMAWVNQNFRDEGTEQKWAPLSPNTIAARRKGKGAGGAQILRDTGHMAMSFTMEVGANRVEVGTADQKAAWHHGGTRPRIIKPHVAEPPLLTVRFARGKTGRTLARRIHAPGGRPLRFMTALGWRSSYAVRYPGLPARPLIPTQATAEALVFSVVDAFVKRAIATPERAPVGVPGNGAV
jgi:phage gpG-like protein